MDPMSLKPAHHGLAARFARLSGFSSDRRAGIALIVALSAPLLIAATGLSVDVGYWYQNQTSLQSTADAAAVAAASADYEYLAKENPSTPPVPTATATSAAQAAADNATN